jgi:acetyl esterase/lipase
VLAFRWVKEHIEEYGGDLNNVFVTGDSAGGYLCFYSATIARSALLQELVGTVDPELNIRAIGLTCPKVTNSGGFGSDVLEKVMFKEEDKNKPFLQYIGTPSKVYELGAVPPLWFMTTDLDIVRDQCEEFDKYLKATGREYVFRFLHQTEGLEHELRHVFNVTHPDWKEAKEINRDMLEFFGRYMQ